MMDYSRTSLTLLLMIIVASFTSKSTTDAQFSLPNDDIPLCTDASEWDSTAITIGSMGETERCTVTPTDIQPISYEWSCCLVKPEAQRCGSKIVIPQPVSLWGQVVCIYVVCFAYGNSVRTQDRGVIPIEQVKTGDMVESVSDDNTVIYSPVIMIIKQNPKQVVKMVKIKTEFTQKTLTLSGRHLVKVSVDDGETWTYLFAGKAKSGMLVMITDMEGTVKMDRIYAVSRKTHTGIYAPVTANGNIVVDSVVASCYGNHPDHFLKHLLFAPIRWAHKWAPSIYDGDKQDENGSHPYIVFINTYLRWLAGNDLVFSQESTGSESVLHHEMYKPTNFTEQAIDTSSMMADSCGKV